MVDAYGEIPDSQCEIVEGVYFYDTTVQRDYGLISAKNDDGDFLRIFKVHPDDKPKLNKTYLEDPVNVVGMSGDSQDFQFPAGLIEGDVRDIKKKLLDCIQARNAQTPLQVEAAAIVTILKHYGMTDIPIITAIERVGTDSVRYDPIRAFLSNNFTTGPDPNDTFGMAALKKALHVEHVADVNLPVKQTGRFSGGFNPVVRDISRTPGGSY